MIRFTLLVTALYGICCVMAWGQPNAAPREAEASTPPAPPIANQRDPGGPLTAPHGGSILKATLARDPSKEDPERVKYSELSVIAVPLPKPRVVHKHDLVTIIVREESQSSSKGTTDLKKNADIDAKIDAYVNMNFKKLALEAHVPNPAPEIKGEFARNFKGDATVDRSDTLTARIGAEVLDVKPNGTIVIQARKHIKTDEEEQEFVLTGSCRAEDIGPDNSVVSNTLHDLDVKKSTKGAARDTTKRGWIPRLLDWGNPF
jgi:flagellar L-ring protein precursor FlgH